MKQYPKVLFLFFALLPTPSEALVCLRSKANLTPKTIYIFGTFHGYLAKEIRFDAQSRAALLASGPISYLGVLQ
jgi:hypothetical protein